MRVFGGIVGAVDDRGRVEEMHEFCKGFRLAVVRCGAGEDKGISLCREKFGEFVVLGAAVDQVVALVDDDGVPLLILEVVLVARGVLQCVDGDDHPLVVAERIPCTRQRLPDLLDTAGVEADERNREASPELSLELLQDGSRGHDEDAFATASADQLRQ